MEELHRPPDPSLQVLKDASRRLNDQTEVHSGIALGMNAAGVPQKVIADVMGVTQKTVSHAISKYPNGQALIQDYRDRLKSLKIQKAFKVEAKLWKRLEKEVDEGDAKSVDAIARAIGASEKVQVSVSGESQKIDVNNLNNQPQIDLKVLINQVLGDNALEG